MRVFGDAKFVSNILSSSVYSLAPPTLFMYESSVSSRSLNGASALVRPMRSTSIFICVVVSQHILSSHERPATPSEYAQWFLCKSVPSAFYKLEENFTFGYSLSRIINCHYFYRPAPFPFVLSGGVVQLNF